MKTTSLCTIVSALVISSVTATACAVEESADAENSADAVRRASEKKEAIKLYPDASGPDAADCDHHELLTLVGKANGPWQSAHVHHKAVGAGCPRATMTPMPLAFNLDGPLTDICGSTILTGDSVSDPEFKIRVIDHRTRQANCPSLEPSDMVVELTSPGPSGPETKKLYAASNKVTVEGTLTRARSMTGETTGFSISTANGVKDLVLDASEKTQFRLGAKARVVGKITELPSTLNPAVSRKAIEVDSLLVCPAQRRVNCMPGPNVTHGNVCEPANKNWVRANCPGVTILQ